MVNFNIFLFDGFETLDAFGPAEIIGMLPEQYKLHYYSISGGLVTSSHNIRVDTISAAQTDMTGVLLIPGGMGTRPLVNDEKFIEQIKAISQKADYVLTVCTGSALLAKTGLLKGKQATTNKRAFDWVCSIDQEVNWQRKARWTIDGNFYTSSGVSAGMDMTLGFVSDTSGIDNAVDVARRIEYIWNPNKDDDPFAGKKSKEDSQ